MATMNEHKDLIYSKTSMVVRLLVFQNHDIALPLP